MKVVTLLGRVLDPRGIVVNRRRGRIFVNVEEYLVQPADRCALEVALRIKESIGAEVIALPRGPLPDDDVLRQALATGADRAIYLTADKPYDDGAWTQVLAAAVERLGGADLILTGATTLDAGQGQLGPRLAEALGWPQIVGAWSAEVTDGRIRAVLHRDGEYVAVEADLPAVVTVQPGAVKPRYPDGVRLINVYRGVGEVAEALERWEVADLVDVEALKPLLERRGRDFPPERERGVRLTGAIEEIARAAADALRERL